MPPDPPVTELLRAWSAGDTTARDRLIPLIYIDLRRRAAAALRRERQGHSLQATALVHETFLRLVDQRTPNWKDRGHFYGIAARLMRQILVDRARAQQAAKRGAGLAPVSLDELPGLSTARPASFLELDEALHALAAFDPGKSQLVELHFFGGLSLEEAARALSISLARAKRDWTLARAWLYRRMRGRP